MHRIGPPPVGVPTVPPEIRRAVGITDNLLRLSVGLENKKDLVADIKHALAAAAKNGQED